MKFANTNFSEIKWGKPLKKKQRGVGYPTKPTSQEQRTALRIKDLKSAATLDAEETAKEKATTEFLNELRESGITNMWCAGKYIENEFGVSKKEAKEILLRWMKNFKK